jgi:hypothetical protein
MGRIGADRDRRVKMSWGRGAWEGEREAIRICTFLIAFRWILGVHLRVCRADSGLEDEPGLPGDVADAAATVAVQWQCRRLAPTVGPTILGRSLDGKEWLTLFRRVVPDTGLNGTLGVGEMSLN